MKKKYILPKNATRKSMLLFVKKHYVWILLGILFLVYFFLRFYQFSERASWGWDQVDFAWNAKKILINGEYPLFGMAAKGNSGIYMGPFYYYLSAIFYKLTDLHPIASAYLAGVTGIVSFFVLYFITKKLFSVQVALIAAAISTFSIYSINHDRIQWSVGLISPVSLIIFFALYKIITGSPKYILVLAVALGISLHIHFTSLFYFLLTFLALPFFPRTKASIKYVLYAIPLFIITALPVIIGLTQVNQSGGGVIAYLQENYHGIYARRIVQVAHDAFIQFQAILYFKPLGYVSFIFLPLFLIVYLYKDRTRKKILFSYLTCMWFIVPWIAFSTYRGEISDYYFFLTRPIAIMILAFLTYKAIQYRWYVGIVVVAFWLAFIFVNLREFFREPENEFAYREMQAREKIEKGDPIDVYENIPESYWHWYMKEYKK